MFDNLAEDIAFLLIKNKIVSIDEREVYVYGITVFLLNASLLLITLIMSLLFGEFIHFAAFVIFFIPLRLFAGGYHAATSEKCMIQSVVLYAISLLAVKALPELYKSAYTIAAGIICLIIIFIFAPMVHKNNELNERQYKRNKIIARAIIVIDVALFVPCYTFNLRIASSEIVFIGFVCALMLVARITYP